jgi:hypothetical protein
MTDSKLMTDPKLVTPPAAASLQSGEASRCSPSQGVSSGGSVAGLAGRLLRSPRGLIGLAVVLIVAGGAFNWSWLVAAGVAPIILATAPCLVMCALGLCMMGGMGSKSSGSSATGVASDSSEGAGPSQGR